MSLALGFFNLLPLPLLDGAAILTAFLGLVVTRSRSRSIELGHLERGVGQEEENEEAEEEEDEEEEEAEGEDEAEEKEPSGWLERALAPLALTERATTKLETWLTYWTIAVGTSLAVSTIMVQMLE